jgi:hypothetical protein
MGLRQLLGKLGRSSRSRDRLPDDPVARLQHVYDSVLRDVVRTGQNQPVREVTEIFIARLRQAFPVGTSVPRSPEDWKRDVEHLARRERVLL